MSCTYEDTSYVISMITSTIVTGTTVHFILQLPEIKSDKDSFCLFLMVVLFVTIIYTILEIANKLPSESVIFETISGYIYVGFLTLIIIGFFNMMASFGFIIFQALDYIFNLPVYLKKYAIFMCRKPYYWFLWIINPETLGRVTVFNITGGFLINNLLWGIVKEYAMRCKLNRFF